MSDLTQVQADYLFQLPKTPKAESRFTIPLPGGALKVELTAAGSTEEFMLDVGRGRIELLRGKLQHRVRTNVVLARVDIGGAPHRNPDGVELPCPHLHRFREGYGDKWACMLPMNLGNFDNIADLLPKFLDFCNISGLSFERKDLFS